MSFPAILTRLPNWLEIILLALVLWLAAGFFWLLIAPSTQGKSLAMPAKVPETGAATSAAFLQWFEDNTVADADSSGDLKLIAVISGKEGVAIFKIGEASSVVARTESEVRPGSRLISVEASQVTIEQGGGRQILRLPQSASAPMLTPVANGANPQQRTLRPLDITRGQMSDIIQSGNIGTWDKGLSTAQDGGIRIDDAQAQALPKMLKLQNGDILKRINDRPLVQIADVSLIYHFFGQQAAVDLIFIRNGATLTQHYTIKP